MLNLSLYLRRTGGIVGAVVGRLPLIAHKRSTALGAGLGEGDGGSGDYDTLPS